MLATNFQDFNKTEIDLPKSTASATVTDKKVFIIEFDEGSNFKLGNQEMTMSEIKEKIIFETKSVRIMVVLNRATNFISDNFIC